MTEPADIDILTMTDCWVETYDAAPTVKQEAQRILYARSKSSKSSPETEEGPQ